MRWLWLFCPGSAFLLDLPRLARNPHWLSRRTSSSTAVVSLSSKTRARILPAKDSKVTPLLFEQSDFSPLFLYRDTVTASRRSPGTTPFFQHSVNKLVNFPRSCSPPRRLVHFVGRTSIPGALCTFVFFTAVISSSREGGLPSSSGSFIGWCCMFSMKPSSRFY